MSSVNASVLRGAGLPLNPPSMRSVLFALSALVLVGVVGLPISAIILYALFPHINEGSLAQAFSVLWPNLASPTLIEAIFNSVVLALSVVGLSQLLAVPLAALRARVGVHVGRWLDTGLLLPLLIPPYIGSMAWIQLLQRRGFVDQIVGIDLHALIFSRLGIALVMALHLFPLVYFSARGAFATIGARYLEAAAVAGARSGRQFLFISLPLVIPALLASGLMVFVLTIEEFGTPDIIGRRFGFEVIVTAIHDKLSDWPIDLPGASVLSLVLIALALIAYLGQLWLNRRFAVAVEAGALASLSKTKRSRWVLLPFVGLLIAAVILPLLSITVSAFMNIQSGGLQLSNLGWRGFAPLMSFSSTAWQALGTSLLLATAAALCCVLLALVAAYTLIRLRPRGSGMLEFLTVLPNSVPGMAVAVGLILTWNQPFWPVTPYNTLGILLLAYVCLMLPYPMRMLTAALQQYPRTLDEAALVGGAGELRVLWQILLPLLAPVALASGLIVFAISTRELVTSLMLAPPGVETVATYVFGQFDQGSVNQGMALSLVAILLSATLIRIGQQLEARVKQ